MVQQCWLIAFDHQEEITPALLHDGVGGLHLGVERIQQCDGAVQVQPPQQALASRDLVAFVGHRLHAQGPAALGVDGAHQLGAAAAAHRLAIEHHHVPIIAAQTRLLPGPDGLLELQHRHGFEHPVNAVLRWRLVTPGLAIEPTAKGRALPLR